MTKYGYCTKVKGGVIPFREIAERLSAQEGYPVSVHGVKHTIGKLCGSLRQWQSATRDSGSCLEI